MDVFSRLFKAGICFLFVRAVYWFSSNKRIAIFARKIWCGNSIKVAQAIVTNKHLCVRIDISFCRVSSLGKEGSEKKARNIRFRHARLISNDLFPFRRKKYVQPCFPFYPVYFVRHLLPNVTRHCSTYIRERICNMSRYILTNREGKGKKSRTSTFSATNIFFSRKVFA